MKYVIFICLGFGRRGTRPGEKDGWMQEEEKEEEEEEQEKEEAEEEGQEKRKG